MESIDTKKEPVVKKDWKLIGCIYDYTGMRCNEIEDPKDFAECVKEGEQISWFIATIIDYKGSPIIRIELEGSKENLEYVFSLMRAV